jgi:hypothetical protein
VEEQQDRILPVFATNGDPLLDAADLDVPAFIDAVGIGDGIARAFRLRKALIIASNF